jgi:serine/threonine protein kinase
LTPAEAPASRVGELLAGKYRIVRFIGEGGMGTVYEAYHAVVRRRFAVKFLRTGLAKTEEALRRFEREAQAAGALESENIASVVDFGYAADGIPYIIMEFLVGEDLGKILASQGMLPVARAVKIIIQACRGLDAAHKEGIIHRDLKPENLFVCRRGDGTDLVKILDFGIAKLAQTNADGPVAPLTQTGAHLGTPTYMSPEQARGAKHMDHRVDVYGLGVILFEALTEHRPHTGDSYNAILHHILTYPPTSIATLRSDLPQDLVEIIHRTLALNPDDRPATVMHLANALSRHAGRQATPIPLPFNVRVAGGSDSSSDREPTLEIADHGVTRGKRRRAQWLVAGLLLALAGTAATIILRHRGNASSRGGLLRVDSVPESTPSTRPQNAWMASPHDSALPPTTPSSSPPAGPKSASEPHSAPTAEGQKSAAKQPRSVVRPVNRPPSARTPTGASSRPFFDRQNPYQ